MDMDIDEEEDRRGASMSQQKRKEKGGGGGGGGRGGRKEERQEKGRSKGKMGDGESHGGETFKLEVINVAEDDGERGLPYVAYFPSGVPKQLEGSAIAPEGDDDDDDDDDDDGDRRDKAGNCSSRVSVLKNKVEIRSQQRLIVAEVDDVDYVGSTFGGEASLPPVCRYAVWMVNKTTGMVHVVPISGNKIVRMEPRVRGIDYDIKVVTEKEKVAEAKEKKKEMANDKTGAEQTKELMLKRDVLTTDFGSKKNRVKVQSRDRGRVDEKDDVMVGSVLKLAAASSPAMAAAAGVDENSYVHNVPPHNLDAQTEEMAYPLDRLISPEELEALDIWTMIKDARSGKDMEPKYPAFVVKRFSLVNGITKQPKSNSMFPRPVIALAYLSCILKFYHAPMNFFRGGRQDAGTGKGELGEEGQGPSMAATLGESLGIPLRIVEGFLKRFTEQASDSFRPSYRRPQHLTDLLIGYTIVLGLHVDNFKSDPLEMGLEIKLESKKMYPRYREIGCKLQRSRLSKAEEEQLDSGRGMKLRACLPVPLKFPGIKIGRKR